MPFPLRKICPVSLSVLLFAIAVSAADYPPPIEADFVARNFQFNSGEAVSELRIHYTTLGKPTRDAGGVVRNAVLITHGTTGSGRGFLSATFAGQLFGSCQLLDATKYFIILPDGIGHGKIQQAQRWLAHAISEIDL